MSHQVLPKPRMDSSPNPNPLTRVMIVAGEASGDLHAAALVRSLKQKLPALEVFGMGGSALRAEGAETVIDSEKSASVMGLTEVLGSIRQLIAAAKSLVSEAEKRRPEVVVLIDFPDFNLRLAKALKKKGFCVLYFVTPQIWAWRTGRVHAIRKNVAAVLPIFPFEEAFFREHGVEAHYVGHPFLDRPALSVSRNEFLSANGLDPDRQVLALLPGSRHAEVKLLLEPLLDAYRRLRVIRPGLQAVIPVAPTFSVDEIKSHLREADHVIVLHGQAREILTFCDVAVVASGTVTVEAALAEAPCVVVYKFSPLTYRIARLLVRGVQHFAMANLVAGKTIVPELLQEQVTGENIAVEVERVLGDPKKRRQMKDALRAVRARFQMGLDPNQKAVERAADVVLELADRRNQKR